LLAGEVPQWETYELILLQADHLTGHTDAVSSG